MNDEYRFDTSKNEQDYDCQINNLKDDKFYLTEEILYSPSDDRTWKSYVEDIDGGDTFIDYCEYIFDFLEETGYYD